MNIKQMFRALSIILLVGFLSACGGGASTTASGGMSGTGAKSYGVITAFGSIFVNGVEYDTASAKVSIDGNQNRPETDLKIGMVVRVTGSVNGDHLSGNAQNIEFEGELVGPVDAAPIITPTGGTLKVFGQTVIVDSTTVFDNATGLKDLLSGTIVEVSGLRDSTGQIHATRIEVKNAASANFQVKGSISEVTATTFRLGSLTVNYANAVPENFPSAGLSNGLFVKVNSSTVPVNGVLVATNVKVQSDGIGAQEQDEEEVEGYVTGLAGNNFAINGQAVTVNAQTQYENGMAAALVNNARVEVEGTIVNGVLVANKVKFRLSADIQIEAQVSQIDPAAGTITILGNPGIVVKVVANTTELRDESNAPIRSFNLKSIAVGDRVAVWGIKGSANSIVATRLERTNASLQVVLSGTVDSAVSPTLVILGVKANTNTATVFTDSNNNISLTQVEFFNLAKAGRIVKVVGTFDGTAISTVSAELEN